MKSFDLKDLLSKNPKIKYACAKKAIFVSNKNPELIYPQLKFLDQFLYGENKILKWTAMQIIGNLSSIDKMNLIDKYVPVLISSLSDKSMVTASNSAEALSNISKNKQKFEDQILKALIKVEKNVYYSKGKISPECRNVAIQNVLKSFEKLDKSIYKRTDIKNFLKRQLKNPRIKVRELAEKQIKIPPLTRNP